MAYCEKLSAYLGIGTAATYTSIAEVIQGSRADYPIYVFHPKQLLKNLQTFKQYFAGKLLYAVKANHDLELLKLMVSHGQTAFDVASLAEIELIHSICPQARLFFMNPVKYPSSIASAYHDFGVRRFVLDADWELDKIIAATNHAKDLHLFVRIAVPNTNALIKLTRKFGAPSDKALVLINKAKRYADKISIAFHVGSQCLNSDAYAVAMQKVSDLMQKLSFPITAINIGGGFPTNYTNRSELNLENYLKRIQSIVAQPNFQNIQLYAEPGRAIVASAYSLLARVIGRKGRQLYLSDGIFGGLADISKDIMPAVNVYADNRNKQFDSNTEAFLIWGPSCDSEDKVNARMLLPCNIAIGDWIEFHNMGAYSKVLRSNFNGFYTFQTASLA